MGRAGCVGTGNRASVWEGIRRSLHNFRQSLGGWSVLGSGASQPGSSESSLTHAGGALLWLSTAVCAAAPQLEPGLQGAAPNTAALCSLWRALLFGFAFIAGFLLCPHGTSQTLTLIKKSNEFWSMESDLDQAEVRTESFVPSLWTRLLSRHFTPRPSPGHAARRSVLWCWPSLTAAFCSAICHWLFLILVHVWVTEAFLVWSCQRSSPAELPWRGFSAGAVLHRRQGCDALSRHEVNNANLTPVKAQKWNSSNFKNPV